MWEGAEQSEGARRGSARAAGDPDGLAARSVRARVTWCGARCWATADSLEKGGARGWSPRLADFTAARSGHPKVQTPAASILHPPSPSTSAFFVPLRELATVPEDKTTEVGASPGA